MREHLEFFRQFRQRFETTGSVIPSSRFLARAILRPLRGAKQRPIRVLEVGPGTGAFTKFLVQSLQPNDRLDIVELNESFVRILEQKFANAPSYAKVAQQTQIHCCPLQEFICEDPYDFIVSGLPFANFPAALVDEVLGSFFKFLKPGGSLSYFEYMYVRPLRKLISNSREKQRLSDLDEVVSRYISEYGESKDWVFVNFPPAWVQHLVKPVE